MLDRIHKLSEILAAVAVILSLVFVGMQLRDNTKAVRASMAQASVANWADSSMAVATNDELIGAIRADFYPVRTPQTKDQLRASWYANWDLKTSEFSYLQWLDGNLSDDLWQGWRSGLVSAFALQKVYERDWPGSRRQYSSRFQALVNKEIIPEARAARAKFYRDNPDLVVPSEPAPATDAPM